MMKNLKFPLLFLFALYGVSLWVDFWEGSFAASDIAGDVLNTLRIERDGYLLVGHWSKFGFSHPGPFWFYCNFIFEKIFIPFGLTKLQAWQWGVTFLNAVFLIFSAIALSKLYFKNFNFKYAFLFVALYAVFAKECSGIWIPYRLTAAYLLFVIALLHLIRGNFNYLIIAVFTACILIHGYATMPFFTLPFLLVAIVFGLKSKNKIMTYFKTQSIVAVFIAIIFASPIFIDAYLNNPSNLDYLFQASRKMQMDLANRPTFDDVLFTVPRLVITDGAGHFLNIFYSSLIIILFYLMIFLPRGTFHKKDFFFVDTFQNIRNTILLCFALYFVCIFYHWKYTSDLNYYSMFYLMALPPILYTTLLTPLLIAANKTKQKNIFSFGFLIVLIGMVFFKNIDTNQNLNKIFMSPYRHLSRNPTAIYLKNFVEKEYAKSKKSPLVFADIYPTIEKLFPNELQRKKVGEEIAPSVAVFITAATEAGIPVCIAFAQKTLEAHPHIPFFYTPKLVCPPNTKADVEFIFAPPQTCGTNGIVCMALVATKDKQK